MVFDLQNLLVIYNLFVLLFVLNWNPQELGWLPLMCPMNNPLLVTALGAGPRCLTLICLAFFCTLSLSALCAPKRLKLKPECIFAFIQSQLDKSEYDCAFSKRCASICRFFYPLKMSALTHSPALKSCLQLAPLSEYICKFCPYYFST